MHSRVQIQLIHRRKNSVEPGRNAVVSDPGHTTGVQRVGSDEPGAIPRVKRRAGRRQWRHEGGRNRTRPAFRQGHGHDGRGGNCKLFLRAGVGRDRRQRLRAGRWRGTATHLAATMTAGMSWLFGARWRNWRSQQLRPHQQQAEQNGAEPFHKFIRAQGSGSNHFLGAAASWIFFRYLAGSLSKSFLHPVQHNLTSWP